jgi:CheY-like chemotaxis protein
MSSSPKPTVLIVEDEALIAMSIEIQLQDMGYKTLVVSSIEAATAALAQRAIDLAILDYKLRDGEKTTPVAEALHERRIPFVVCSGSQFNDMAAIFEGPSCLSPTLRICLPLRSARRSQLATSELGDQANDRVRDIDK